LLSRLFSIGVMMWHDPQKDTRFDPSSMCTLASAYATTGRRTAAPA
jgi:hypothetical protein